MGGSVLDVQKEANDIIEEFKKEEELTGQKLVFKRNSHSATLNIINIGIPVPLGNLHNNSRTAKMNNFAL